ncbi:MAG: HD domain-containing protein [Candidatus Dormibacteraeota bacterium]|nr:HD domain-containing protein [Candidatus Dormibacteraeota bacterium]
MPERRAQVTVLPADPAPDLLIDSLEEMERDLRTRACVVGGYVRDLVMGRASSPDVDLVLDRVDAERGAQWLSRRWGRRGKVVAFERYGTAQVSFPLSGGSRFTVELVRARSEAYSRESRKPQVAPATLEQDVMRRDFTINTLLLTGRRLLLDPTGWGLADIRARVLRTPLDPDQTFDEDPLRMFRAARFASQLDFELADGVEEAMSRARHRLRIVSAERLRDELVKLLLGVRPSAGMHILRRTGILAEVLPELDRMHSVAQGGYHLGDVFEHTAMALDLAPSGKVLRLAVLFHDIGKPDTLVPTPAGPTFHRHQRVGAEIAGVVMRRLRFSNSEVGQVQRLVEMHMRPIQYRKEWADSAVRRLWRDAGALGPLLLELARADTRASSYPGTDELDDLEERMRRVGEEHPRGLDAPLGGNRLKQHFGLSDGPWIGRAKRLLVEALLDGRLQAGDSSDEERALILLDQDRSSWWPRPGEAGGPTR